MYFKSLIEPKDLNINIHNPNWCIIDCRFSIDDTNLGYEQYLAGHIPKAIYAHLDDDLSGPITKTSSRHPLPPIDELVVKFSKWAIDEDVQVVVYDDLNGMVASRLWWMLQWLGHENVAVLNGGFQYWVKNNYSIETTVHQKAKKIFSAKVNRSRLASSGDVELIRLSDNHLLVDSRAPERFSGKEEKLDIKAGHIPGAVNLYYGGNLDENGLFLSKDILKKRFSNLHEDIDINNIIYYCGSGVSANHNLLAIKYAGLGNAKLYSGSWSEWITDPTRPTNP